MAAQEAFDQWMSLTVRVEETVDTGPIPKIGTEPFEIWGFLLIGDFLPVEDQ